MDEIENEEFCVVGLEEWKIMLPPNLLPERFISNKDEVDQNQLGTWPCKELPERSKTWRLDMFLR